MKVHITLRADVCADSDAKERAKEQIIELGQMENVNEKRFSRYGVLSGDLDPSRISLVKALREVETVEQDGMKKAI